MPTNGLSPSVATILTSRACAPLLDTLTRTKPSRDASSRRLTRSTQSLAGMAYDVKGSQGVGAEKLISGGLWIAVIGRLLRWSNTRTASAEERQSGVWDDGGGSQNWLS